MKRAVLFAAGVLSVCFITDKVYADGYISDKKASVVEGVRMEDKALTGFDKEKIEEEINSHIKTASEYEIHLSLAEDEEKKVSYPLNELELEPVNTHFVDELVYYGNKGNLFQREIQRKELRETGLDLDLKLETKEESVKSLVDKAATELNIAAKDGSLKRENGNFVIQPGVVGHELDKAEAVERIVSFVNEEWEDNADINLRLSSSVTVPRGTQEELSKVKDLIGTATTTYAAGGNRGMNLANGAAKINGSLVYPNEVFSVYEAVHPFNRENGYYLAGAYENGTVIQSYGGGICQVSSTLYNAALAAEMGIVERSAHSMIVTYLEPSKDAAIAGTYKDLKFKNVSEYPIYIEGRAGGGRLQFDIYGYENRPKNRVVKYVSEVTSTTPAGVKYVEVDQPIGYKKVVQGAHVGHTARLVKVVIEDGVENREVINTSTYRASPKIIEIGVKSDVEGASEAIRAALKSKDTSTVDSAVAEWKNVKKEEKKEDKTEDKKTKKKEEPVQNTADEEDDWTDGSEDEE